MTAVYAGFGLKLVSNNNGLDDALHESYYTGMNNVTSLECEIQRTLSLTPQLVIDTQAG